MTIHFAAARTGNASVMARALRVPAITRAANDDPLRDEADAVLAAALRHFAAHGLAAADRAEEKARKAATAGDCAARDRWLEICATLDPRRARDLNRQLAQRTSGRACN
jgi:hypothetical protein